MTNEAHVVLLSVNEINEQEYPLATGKDITPGMLCELTGTTALSIQPHSNASAIPAEVLVANVAPWRLGSGLEDPFDQDGESVPVHKALPGDKLYMLLAAGEQVDSFADRLGSNGDGTIQIATTYAFLKPLELVDNSAGYESVRIRVEVL